MNVQTMVMDAVICVVLTAGILVYAMGITRHMDESDGVSHSAPGEEKRILAHSVASRFRRYSILLVSCLMLVGVLYQTGVFTKWLTAVLFALGAISLLIGLVRLKRYIH